MIEVNLLLAGNDINYYSYNFHYVFRQHEPTFY